MLVNLDVDKLVSTYGVHQTGQAGQPSCSGIQRPALRLPGQGRTEADPRRRVPQLRLEGAAATRALGSADDFYFDSITQITSTAGIAAIGLVGDAGYCPGPAVGGGTSLAVITAYVLADELAAARGDLVSGLRNYEERIREIVELSRSIGRADEDAHPGSRWRFAPVPWLFAVLPAADRGATKGVAAERVRQALDSMELPDYSGQQFELSSAAGLDRGSQFFTDGSWPRS